MSLDWDLVRSCGADSVRIKILDNANFASAVVDIVYTDGEELSDDYASLNFTFPVLQKDCDEAVVYFHAASSGSADVVIVEVSYLKNGAVVGSSLVQNGNCELKLLKYKVELPRGAKVTLFDDETLEAQFVSWYLPCPTTLPNMTFLQVKAANGFEQQITPSAGSYSVEVWSDLGRRYAVFGEIWSYSFAQTLWFADLKVQLSNYEWQDVVPTAGEGGTIVTALPQ